MIQNVFNLLWIATVVKVFTKGLLPLVDEAVGSRVLGLLRPTSTKICRILGVRIGNPVKITEVPKPIKVVPIKPPVKEPVPVKRQALQRRSTVGYRMWNVLTSGSDFLLASVSYNYIWVPGDNVAVCSEGKLEEHLRHADHSCGFYALKKFTRAPVHIVPGSTVMWGIVIEGEEGYRSQYAAVDAVATPLCGFGDQLATIAVGDAGHIYDYLCDKHSVVAERDPSMPFIYDIAHVMKKLATLYDCPWVEYPITPPVPPGEQWFLDTKTGAKYWSETEAAVALAREYGKDPGVDNIWSIWFTIVENDPWRLKREAVVPTTPTRKLEEPYYALTPKGVRLAAAMHDVIEAETGVALGAVCWYMVTPDQASKIQELSGVSFNELLGQGWYTWLGPGSRWGDYTLEQGAYVRPAWLADEHDNMEAIEALWALFSGGPASMTEIQEEEVYFDLPVECFQHAAERGFVQIIT
jgi:hypothetical protein